MNNGIDTEHVGEIEVAWLHNIAERITEALRLDKDALIELLNDEVSEDYQVSVKRAIVDFVLKDTNVSDASPAATTAERKELTVVPKPWAAAYHGSRDAMIHTLHITNPLVRFTLSHSIVTLADVCVVPHDELNASMPFEIGTFNSFITDKCRATKTYVLTSFCVGCLWGVCCVASNVRM